MYMYMYMYMPAGPKTVLVKRTFLENALSEVMMGWGGGGLLTFLVHRTLYVATLGDLWCDCYVVCCYAAHDGVGWGGACRRSLYFVRYMLLRCRDLRCSCYVICCYAALRTLYVATLQRSLMLLLRSMLLPLIRSVAILEQLMLHGVLSKTSSPIHRAQRAKIFSCLSNAGNGDL